jgi:tripartite-type tricarboxylate transporter receptor subunit TctC
MAWASSVVLGVLCSVATLYGPVALSQSYPARPIRIVIPFPPGNPADTQARLIGEKLSARFGQPVVADNRPGATGQIGIEAAAKSAADGYTLVVGQVGTFAVAPHVFKKLPYDVTRDFVAVSQFSSNTLVLVVNANVPVASVQELVQLSKQKPGAFKFGSNGEGGLPHLTMELFRAKTGVDWLHIPYKGTTQAVTDLLSGQIDLVFDTYGGAAPHAKAGKVKVLASTGARRLEAAPDLPTLIEAGVPDFEVYGWFGAFAPAGTPTEIVRSLNKAINEVLSLPDVRERIRALGLDVGGGTPEQFAATMMDSYNLWGHVVKSIGLTPQ